jgi:coproporphyrinogen III oxidase-like Fe-S oxidoreductase
MYATLRIAAQASSVYFGGGTPSYLSVAQLKASRIA